MFEQRVTDLSYLRKIFKGNTLLARKMIGLFLTETPQSLEDIKRSIRQENWPGVEAAAHKLKPNLAYMGLRSARLLILDLEKNARESQEQEQALSQVNSIEQICKQAYKELNAELEEL